MGGYRLTIGDPLPDLYAQSVDVKKEVINLECAEADVAADSLPGLVPENSPRYHLFLFKHTHEGDYQEAVGKSECKESTEP